MIKQYYRSYLRLAFLLSGLVASTGLSSCASSKSSQKKMPRLSTGDFKVSVETGGKKISNPDVSLLRRIRIKNSDIANIFGTASSPRLPDIKVRKAYDSQGGLMGLSLQQETPVSRAMGLEVGDVLTAVGTQRFKTERDLLNFGKLFHSQPELSFTYERKGEPRKTIFYKAD